MAQLLDLPVEILCNIFSYLRNADLFQATLVGNLKLHDAARRTLYRIIGHEMGREPENDLWEVSRTNAIQCFIRTLNENRNDVGLYTRQMHVCLCWPETATVDGGFKSRPDYVALLLLRVPNVRFLHLRTRMNILALGEDGDGVLLRLDTIMILGISLETVPRILCQPRLKKIWLYASGDYLFDGRRYRQLPAIARPLEVTSHTSFRAVSGKELVLESVKLPTKSIEELVRYLGQLESLIFIRRKSLCALDRLMIIDDRLPDETCSGMRMEGFDRILAPVRESLEKLVLLWNDSFFCEYDTSVLEPLREFVNLRNLKIEDTFLFGNDRLCLQHRDVVSEKKYDSNQIANKSREAATQ
ncbi:hypothetical protein H2200_001958 [Cladophialophora chaetospira]|uniref:F-box domain-containing protein n=1 Tax=Cladophialophora chaetospira TaxID=386627 RepID=A0AA39CPJ3_9EURO|nr:hypothetical protein H2200_001958 [Cladophialophora chaetospira]